MSVPRSGNSVRPALHEPDPIPLGMPSRLNRETTATSNGDYHRQAFPVASSNGTPSGTHRQDDPFATETPPSRPHPNRFSSFDTQLFALNHPSSSPAQAKRALEAHLAETDRRIQETSKLGTTLVQQRINLSQRLQDVGSQEEEAHISPELRQKLVDIEREYNEVGRQSARAFLGPKSEAAGEGASAPFALDGKASSILCWEFNSVLTLNCRIPQALPNSPARPQIHHPSLMSLESNEIKHQGLMILTLQPKSVHPSWDKYDICKQSYWNAMRL